MGQKRLGKRNRSHIHGGRHGRPEPVQLGAGPPELVLGRLEKRSLSRPAQLVLRGVERCALVPGALERVRVSSGGARGSRRRKLATTSHAQAATPRSQRTATTVWAGRRAASDASLASA